MRTLLIEFSRCFNTLWKDPLGQISLATTTLFWGAGATLQFIVLKWAEVHLGMPLEKATILQGTTAIGIAAGAVMAARWVPLERSTRVLPMGVAMGIAVVLMTQVTWLPMVYALLVLIGAMAGFFVVPMNALLQHRGHVLLSAGSSIAVQNFNENLSILVMLAIYAALLHANLHINTVILLFGCFVSGTMFFVWRRHRRNSARA